MSSTRNCFTSAFRATARTSASSRADRSRTSGSSEREPRAERRLGLEAAVRATAFAAASRSAKSGEPSRATNFDGRVAGRAWGGAGAGPSPGQPVIAQPAANGGHEAVRPRAPQPSTARRASPSRPHWPRRRPRRSMPAGREDGRRARARPTPPPRCPASTSTAGAASPRAESSAASSRFAPASRLERVPSGMPSSRAASFRERPAEFTEHDRFAVVRGELGDLLVEDGGEVVIAAVRCDSVADARRRPVRACVAGRA